MKRSMIIFFSVGCFALGVLVYAISRGWIVIQRPLNTVSLLHDKNHSVEKKIITFYFWHADTWQHDTMELIWPKDTAQQLNLVVSKWLAIVLEEGAYEKRISLQSALVSDTQEAYVSFDRNPIVKSRATLQNLMWFEGLLKTVRNAQIGVRNIYFMTHYQPINDTHFDFSRSWPTTGFMQS
ncbi:hypothetical protein KJZ61_00485 [Candidatus Dependentiae bacterium]|nr:hypothetical protein [Candidatus Dependentiae bacterium]